MPATCGYKNPRFAGFDKKNVNFDKKNVNFDKKKCKWTKFDKLLKTFGLIGSDKKCVQSAKA